MKKQILTFLAFSALAGCTDSEVEQAIAAGGEQSVEPISVYTEVGAVSGAEYSSRAAFDGDLNAFWEAGDQILVVQGRAHKETWVAGGGTFTAESSVMTLNAGEGSATARFGGEVKNYLGDKASYIHFLYPAGTSSLSSKTVIDAWNTSGDKTPHTTYCSLSIASEQDGVWQPSLFASTAGEVAMTAASLGEVRFTNLNSCLAIRVRDIDGNPKQIKHAYISAANNIVGSLDATCSSVRTTIPLTADMFTATATGNTLSATGLQEIAPQADGEYIYHFEVLPVDAGAITITLVDMNGSRYTRSVTLGKPFAANHRHGVNFNWGEISLTADVTSWYEESAGGNLTTGDGISSLLGGQLYVRNVNIPGAEDGTEIYMTLDGGSPIMIGTKADLAKRNYIHTVDTGTHDVRISATVGDRQVSDSKVVTVTGQLSLGSVSVRSSYSDNGTTSPTNSIGGSIIRASVAVNGAYGDEAAPEAAILYNGGATLFAGQRASSGTTASWEGTFDWGEYRECYAKLTFPNGMTATSAGYNTTVTGIPFEANWVTDNRESNLCTLSNASDKGSYLRIEAKKTGGAITPVFNYTGNIKVSAAASGTGTSGRKMYVGTVSGTTLLTSGSSMDTTYNVGSNTDTGYTEWTASSLALTSTNNRVSVAVYGGKFAIAYEGYLYKVKVEYK